MKYADCQWVARIDELLQPLQRRAFSRPGRYRTGWLNVLGLAMRVHRFFWVRGVRF